MSLDYNSNTKNNDARKAAIFAQIAAVCSGAVLAAIFYIAMLVSSIHGLHQENLKQIQAVMNKAGGAARVINNGIDTFDTFRTLRRKQ